MAPTAALSTPPATQTAVPTALADVGTCDLCPYPLTAAAAAPAPTQRAKGPFPLLAPGYAAGTFDYMQP
jgi:hypothetical protein